MRWPIYALSSVALIIGVALLAFQWTSPGREEAFTYIGAFYSVHSEVSPEARASILKEILDPKLIRFMAKARGLSEKELATVRLAFESRSKWVKISQIGKSEKAFDLLTKDLEKYFSAREEGHSQDYVLAALSDRLHSSSLSNPDLRILATNDQSLIAVSRLTKVMSGTITNKAGIEADRSTTYSHVNGKEVTNVTVHIPKVNEVCGWSRYVAVDGGIAWEYTMQLKVDGTLRCLLSEKLDAKEYDPNYAKQLKAVEKEVTQEMNRKGIDGIGSCHVFWNLKKRKLKAQGIDWRSPRELNRNRCYD